MQPRIYTYKITFEEVPYYYYGSKKEKYYNQPYMGSPKTHKWMWDFYTPKKQILEFFEYNDNGYEECRKVEDRLIKPVLNDPWCLNEICCGCYSLQTLVKNGNKVKELGIGIFSLTKEERHNNSKKGGKTMAKRNKNNKSGIYAMTSKEKSQAGKKGSKNVNYQKWKCTETGFITNPGNLTKYQKSKGIDTSKRIRIDDLTTPDNCK